MNTDSRMTIEDLAVLIEKRFTQQDSKFTDKIDSLEVLMNKRFVEQESRLETKIDEKLSNFAEIVAIGFAAQGKQIQEIITELRDSKKETNERFEIVDESFRKVRQDIWSLDEKFVTKSEFKQLKTEYL